MVAIRDGKLYSRVHILSHVWTRPLAPQPLAGSDCPGQGGGYKGILAVCTERVAHDVVTVGFLSHSLNGFLPCLIPYITINKMLSVLLDKTFLSFFPSIN